MDRMILLEEDGPLEEGKGQVPKVRMQYGVITVSLVWTSLGLSALDTFLWGPWHRPLIVRVHRLRNVHITC